MMHVEKTATLTVRLRILTFDDDGAEISGTLHHGDEVLRYCDFRAPYDRFAAAKNLEEVKAAALEQLVIYLGLD